ncbi:MAG: sigma-70 family RNA polymerase sigma factor [Candidatus Lindowbacteria bacterium]|nr:sigma-70 family RNA polymerase sigma factor [Candidatus Lindowbacteria bacterium]
MVNKNTVNFDERDPEGWLEVHGDYLYRYALFRVRDPDRAQDLVQETLLAGIQAVDKFSGRSTIRTWLTGILNHKVIDQIRKLSRERSGQNAEEKVDAWGGNSPFDARGMWASPPDAWAANPEALLEQKEFKAVFEKCLERLPDRYFEVFTMREIDNLSSEEVCKAAGISQTNLWVMLHRARNQLRTCVEKNWFHAEK